MKQIWALAFASLTQEILGSFNVTSDAPLDVFDQSIRSSFVGNNNCMALSLPPQFVAAHDQSQDQFCNTFKFKFDDTD